MVSLPYSHYRHVCMATLVTEEFNGERVFFIGLYRTGVSGVSLHSSQEGTRKHGSRKHGIMESSGTQTQ